MLAKAKVRRSASGRFAPIADIHSRYSGRKFSLTKALLTGICDHSLMRQLLYASNTSRDVSDAVLDDILASSRKNNVRAGITGILLFIEGGFMQILEGDAPAVAETFARISKDRRHWNTNILLDRDSPRAFGEWSMGFARIGRDSDPGAFALTEDAIRGRLKPGTSLEIYTLLKTFYRVNL